MKNNITPETLFRFFCEWYGYDWQAIMNAKGFNGTLGDYSIQHDMFDMYKYMMINETVLAWQKGMQILSNIWDTAYLNNIKTDNDYDHYIRLIENHRVWSSYYKELDLKFRREWTEQLKEIIILLTEEERADDTLGDKYPYTYLENVDKQFNKINLYKLYRYKGNRRVKEDDIKRVVYSSTFIISDNVGTYISRLPDGNEEELKVYVFLQTEYPIENSFFIIVMNIGSDWFIATDEADYANPLAKKNVAQRGAYRFRERVFENSVMPYEYLDVVEKKRNNITDLTKKAGRVDEELYVHELKEWSTSSRIYLNLTVNNLIKKIFSLITEDKLENGQFMSEYMKSDRLLTGGEEHFDLTQISDDVFYEGGAINDVINDMLINMDDNTFTELVKIDSDSINRNLIPGSKSFISLEKYQAQRAWAVCQDEYQKRAAKLKRMAEHKTEDKSLLLQMIDKNIHTLYDDIFAGEIVYLYVYDKDYIYDSECSGFSHKHNHILSRLNMNSKDAGPSCVGGAVGQLCRKCDKYELKPQHASLIKVDHYAALSWLTGCLRTNLPDYYKNYMVDNYWPYKGNHLLQNVNPLHLLKDECSENHHHLYFSIRVCQRCRTRYKNNWKFKKAVIVLDRKTGNKVETLDFDSFKDKYLKEDRYIII